jgi:hypothetical protein
MCYIQGFEVHDEENTNVSLNMLNLSQRHYQPLGHEDEHVSVTQSDDEATQENREVVASHEPHIDSIEQI